MILVKNLNFHASLFLFKNNLAILFYNVLKRKAAFLNYKKVILKKSKICIFAKGLTHDFGQKFELSCMFVFIEKTPRNTSK